MCLRDHLHTLSTSCDFPPFLHAFKLTSPPRFGLTLHVIIIVGSASVADKEAGREKRGRGGAAFLDLGDMFWHGGGVEEDMLIESSIFSVIRHERSRLNTLVRESTLGIAALRSIDRGEDVRLVLLESSFDMGSLDSADWLARNRG